MAVAETNTTIEEVGILGRLLLKASEEMTPAMAQFIRTLDFTSKGRARMARLSKLNNRGKLSADEVAELKAFAKAGLVLGRLDLRARDVLKSSPSARADRSKQQ